MRRQNGDFGALAARLLVTDNVEHAELSHAILQVIQFDNSQSDSLYKPNYHGLTTCTPIYPCFPQTNHPRSAQLEKKHALRRP